jgi:NAD(P)-dependent dehydrogenase (short-subunit alcohol dehydrogenase family)
MAREGAQLVLNDLGTDLEGRGTSAEPANEVAAEIVALGGQAIANRSDVSMESGALSIVADARESYGRLDALVNNAAVEFRGPIDAHSSAVFERVLAVNVRGSFNCAHAALPLMREQGSGVILHTTSGSCWEGTEGVLAYSASKAAVISMMLTQHTELSRYGIASNCISPNATRTRMLDAWLRQRAHESDQAEADVIREYGIQSTDNLAPLAVFLCSKEGSRISGRTFEVAGDRIVRVEPPTRGASIERTSERWSFDEIAARLPELAR